MHRVVAFSVYGLAGCSIFVDPEVPPETTATVAVCSAGYGVTLDADLAAGLGAVEQGRSLSFELEQALQGQIFAGADLTDEVILSAYQSYLDCVVKKTNQAEFVASLKSRRDLVLAFLSGRGLSSGEISKLSVLIERHIMATEMGDFQLAHNLHNEINLELISITNSEQNLDGSIAFYDL